MRLLPMDRWGQSNWLVVISAAAVAVILVGPAAFGADNDVEKGRILVERNCARCHAVGNTGESQHPKAPPFRIVAKRYPVEDLAESLAEGIVSGHPDMPVFTFQPDEINAILAYLRSLGGADHK